MQTPLGCPEHVHQHMAVVANDVQWYWLAIAVVVGSALIAYGAQMTFEHWRKEAELSGWFSVAGGIFGIVLASVMGCIAGHILWHWSLGLMCAVCGSWGSQWVLGMLAVRLGVRQEQAPELQPTRRRRRRE